MKKKIRGGYLLITPVFIYLLHLPFAPAKSASESNAVPTAVDSAHQVSLSENVKSVFDSLQTQLPGLSRQVFEFAKKGFNQLQEQGKLLNDSVITIIDFSQPSHKKRLYSIDLRRYKVMYNTWVAHGRNSGRSRVTSLSNKPASFQSSPGFYVTGDTYDGDNGFSLRLHGMEKGINDKAFSRAIVMHGAWYVNPSLVKKQGYIGRSEGCPAVPATVSQPIINTIKEGSCLFIYHPSYIRHSAMLQ